MSLSIFQDNSSSMLLKPLFLFSLFLLHAPLAIASAEDIQKLFCSGQKELAKEYLQVERKKNPGNFDYVLLESFFLLSDTGRSYSQSEGFPETNTDRLTRALVLLATDASKLEEVEELLEFVPKNETQELYRKYFLGLLSFFRGEKESYYESLVSGFRKASLFKTNFLFPFLFEDSEVWKKYDLVELIENMEDKTPILNEMSRFFRLEIDLSGLLLVFKSMRSECSEKTYFEFNYARLLFFAGKLKEAEEVLAGIEENIDRLGLDFHLLKAEVKFSLEKYEEAEDHFQKIGEVDTSGWLPKGYIEGKLERIAQLEKQSRNKKYSYAALLTTVVIFLFLLLK